LPGAHAVRLGPAGAASAEQPSCHEQPAEAPGDVAKPTSLRGLAQRAKLDDGHVASTASLGTTQRVKLPRPSVPIQDSGRLV